MANAMMAPDRNMLTEKARLRKRWTRLSAMVWREYLCRNSLSRIDDELTSVVGVIAGGQRPGEPDAEEHVHRIAAGHVADAGVGVFVLDGGHLAGERVWGECIVLVQTIRTH